MNLPLIHQSFFLVDFEHFLSLLHLESEKHSNSPNHQVIHEILFKYHVVVALLHNHVTYKDSLKVLDSCALVSRQSVHCKPLNILEGKEPE